MDKNQAVIDFLLKCPQIKGNPLFFNFAEVKDNNKQIVTIANDKSVNKGFVDGSVLRRYTFTIIDYRSVAYQSIVTVAKLSNENVDEMFDVQKIINWVTEQAEKNFFPDFGEKCPVESMWAVTDTPNLNGVDTSVKPALAKYSVSVQIEYLDKTGVLWN